jgi:ribonuclease HII
MQTLYTPMLSFEQKYWSQGFLNIAGADEVGRGCVAGPIVAAAVIWDKDFLLENIDKIDELKTINDSKKLTEKKRNVLSELIKNNAKAYSIIEISAKIIDEKGITYANNTALTRAILELPIKADFVLIDHFKVDIENSESITKGDSLSITIASASIIAKVYRDNLMQTKYSQEFPEYGFEKHVGYGTKFHMEKIKEFGLCGIHRRGFLGKYL